MSIWDNIFISALRQPLYLGSSGIWSDEFYILPQIAQIITDFPCDSKAKPQM